MNLNLSNILVGFKIFSSFSNHINFEGHKMVVKVSIFKFFNLTISKL